MIVGLGEFKDKISERTWTSLLIDSISVAQVAVQQLVGGAICKMTLGSHSIYVEESETFVDLSTAKEVFKDIYRKVCSGEIVIMNINGGYNTLSSMKEDWTLVSEKQFEVEGKTNLKDLLEKENNIERKLLSLQN